MWSWVGPTKVPPRSDTSPPSERVAPDPPARPSRRLQHEHGLAAAPHFAGGGQPGQTGADHDDIGSSGPLPGGGRAARHDAGGGARRTRSQ